MGNPKKWLSYPRMDTGAAKYGWDPKPGSEVMESRFAPWNNVILTIICIFLYQYYVGESAQPVQEPVIEVVKTGFRFPWQKA